MFKKILIVTTLLFAGDRALRANLLTDPLVMNLRMGSAGKSDSEVEIFDQNYNIIGEFVDYPSANIFVASLREILPCRLTKCRAAAASHLDCVAEYVAEMYEED